MSQINSRRSVYCVVLGALGIALAAASLKYGIIIPAGAAFALFALYNEVLALGCFFALICVIPHEYWKNPYIFMAFLFFVVIFIMSKRNTLKTPVSLMIYAFTVVLSLFVSGDFSDSLRIFLLLGSGIGFAVLIYSLVDNEKKFHYMVTFLFSAMFLTSLYGLYQKVSGIAIRADFTDTVASAGMPGRLFSTMDNPNNFAGFLVLTLPVCIAYILNLKNDVKRLLFTIAILPGFTCLVMTYSRSAYLAILAAAFIFVVIRCPRLIPLFLILFVISLPFIPSSITDRFMTIGKDTSSEYRMDIWTGVFRCLKLNWLFGIGLGPETFVINYRPISLARTATAVHSHNLILQIWLETGICGLTAFLAVVWSVIKKSLNVIKLNINCRNKNYLAAITATIVGYLFMGMFEYVWYYPRVTLIFWVVVGLGFAMVRIAKNGGEK